MVLTLLLVFADNDFSLSLILCLCHPTHPPPHHAQFSLLKENFIFRSAVAGWKEKFCNVQRRIRPAIFEHETHFFEQLWLSSPSILHSSL